MLILDIETKTDFKTIRLIGVRCVTSGAPTEYAYFYDTASFASFLSTLPQDTAIVTWNGARFDIPLLKKNGVDFSGFKLYDGMQLAKILYPDWPYYSLDYVASSFGIGDKSDFADIDYDEVDLDTLRDYNENDLDLTYQVWMRLYSFSGKAEEKDLERLLRMEHKVAELVTEQVEKGVAFDIPKAQGLVSHLTEEMEKLERTHYPSLPTHPLPASKQPKLPKLQFKKDGTPSAAMEAYAKKLGTSLVCHGGVWYMGLLRLPLTYPCTLKEQLTFRSSDGLKDWLLSNGWEPTEWNRSPTTKKPTSPRLTLKGSGEPCPGLEKVGATWVKDYAQWLTLRSRLNVIQSEKGTGWLPYAKEHDGVIPSDADTLGANSGRWTHRRIANVPRVTSAYGKQMRELFHARPGKVWVGWDATALEAMMEAHYVFPYDPGYASDLVHGDVHERNLAAIPALLTRDRAKTFKYAITYGAGPTRIANTLGLTKSQALSLYEQFWETNQGLKRLADFVKLKHETKRDLVGLDGRPLKMRSAHSGLNLLFQSAGAILMKYAMIIASHKIKEEFGDRACGLIRYHDEEIWECDQEIAERVGQIGIQSLEIASSYLGLQFTVTGIYKIGNNWAEVH